jgi:NAD(P)-dependent dehydrogenase (short-subunit alcohol dehydrogenase family)
MPEVVVITGAGRGIGAATALAAARQGYAVGVNYRRDAAAAGAVVERIRAAGGRALAVEADVAEPEQVAALFDAVAEALGPVTALVNNAGTTGRITRFADLDLATLRRVIDVNLIGCMLCSQEAVRRFSTACGGQGGAIVNVSSVAAQTGSPGEYVHYAATKVAVEAFTRGLAREVASEGIRVNAVAPGTVQTGIHAAGGDPLRPTRVAARIPLGRVAEPEEIAAAILWLLSPAAAYATGSVLTVAGGL